MGDLKPFRGGVEGVATLPLSVATLTEQDQNIIIIVYLIFYNNYLNIHYNNYYYYYYYFFKIK